MQLINKVKKCSACGCISFPDARYCPRCGLSHVTPSISRSSNAQGIVFSPDVSNFPGEQKDPDVDTNLAACIVLTTIKQTIYYAI